MLFKTINSGLVVSYVSDLKLQTEPLATPIKMPFRQERLGEKNKNKTKQKQNKRNKQTNLRALQKTKMGKKPIVIQSMST